MGGVYQKKRRGEGEKALKIGWRKAMDHTELLSIFEKKMGGTNRFFLENKNE